MIWMPKFTRNSQNTYAFDHEFILMDNRKYYRYCKDIKTELKKIRLDHTYQEFSRKNVSCSLHT